jgi:hypothetical protein
MLTKHSLLMGHYRFIDQLLFTRLKYVHLAGRYSEEKHSFLCTPLHHYLNYLTDRRK